MNLSYSKLHNTCLQCKTSKLPMVPMEQTDSWETQWATHSSTNPYQCQTTSSNTTPIPQIRKKSEHRPLLWPQCGTWSQHWKMLQGSCGFPHKVKRQNSGRSKVNNTWHRPNEASTSQTTSQATPQWTPHLRTATANNVAYYKGVTPYDPIKCSSSMQKSGKLPYYCFFAQLQQWILDSGASEHMSGNISLFTDLYECQDEWVKTLIRS